MRLDLALVQAGLARSRSQARELIIAGRVQVAGTVITHPAEQVSALDEIVAVRDPYVSRAAHKLLGALEDLDVVPAGRALDAGSSTGGFTQVLLERGCVPVYAVDVGTDQLAPALRADPRVRSREQTNLRDLDLDLTDGQPVDLIVADVSFISLRLLLKPLTSVLDPTGVLLVMVKPQFEVGREQLEAGGVVRSVRLRRAAVESVIGSAVELGWHAWAGAVSRLPGPAGNREYFVRFGRDQPVSVLDPAEVVAD